MADQNTIGLFQYIARCLAANSPFTLDPGGNARNLLRLLYCRFHQPDAPLLPEQTPQRFAAIRLAPEEYLIPWKGNDQPEHYDEPTLVPFPVNYSVNAGFPLPGHVLTNSSAGPDNPVWKLASPNGELEAYLTNWNSR